MAEACLDVLGRDQDCSLPVGGPEILTRREIVELVFRAVGREPRILHLAPSALLAGSVLLRPVHPRLSEVTDFASRALTNPFVAPPSGRRRLADHFAEVVRSSRRVPSELVHWWRPGDRGAGGRLGRRPPAPASPVGQQ